MQLHRLPWVSHKEVKVSLPRSPNFFDNRTSMAGSITRVGTGLTVHLPCYMYELPTFHSPPLE